MDLDERLVELGAALSRRWVPLIPRFERVKSLIGRSGRENQSLYKRKKRLLEDGNLRA